MFRLIAPTVSKRPREDHRESVQTAGQRGGQRCRRAVRYCGGEAGAFRTTLFHEVSSWVATFFKTFLAGNARRPRFPLAPLTYSQHQVLLGQHTL